VDTKAFVEAGWVIQEHELEVGGIKFIGVQRMAVPNLLKAVIFNLAL
jgi:hypothetical protein